MTDCKIYFRNPDLFIFVQVSESEQECATRFLEKLQHKLMSDGFEPKILVNCPKRMRINTLHHCFQVNEEKMETNMWYEYGNPVKKRVWIKEFVDVDSVFNDLVKGKDSVYYELKK